MTEKWTKKGNEWTATIEGRDCRITFNPELPFIRWHWDIPGKPGGGGGCHSLAQCKQAIRNQFAWMKSGLPYREWCLRMAAH